MLFDNLTIQCIITWPTEICLGSFHNITLIHATFLFQFLSSLQAFPVWKLKYSAWMCYKYLKCKHLQPVIQYFNHHFVQLLVFEQSCRVVCVTYCMHIHVFLFTDWMYLYTHISLIAKQFIGIEVLVFYVWFVLFLSLFQSFDERAINVDRTFSVIS